MNLATMDYFCALADELSFTHAASRLHVTQQTLSAHIAQLEKELGVRLVNRTVPLSLTYAGTVFLGYAQRFQAERRALEQEFADIAGDERGLLAVGIGSTRGHLMLPQAIASFRRQRPGVDVRIEEGENEEIIESLRTGRIDMAVATVPSGMVGIEVRPLRSEQVVLLVSHELLRAQYGEMADTVALEASQAHDLRPLADCPFLMLGRNDQEGDISRRLVARSGIDAHVAVLSENSETLVELATQGVGACFVEMGVVRATLGEQRMKDMCVVDLGPEARIDVQVAWRSSGHVWSVIQAFADLLCEQAGEALSGEGL